MLAVTMTCHESGCGGLFAEEEFAGRGRPGADRRLAGYGWFLFESENTPGDCGTDMISD